MDINLALASFPNRSPHDALSLFEAEKPSDPVLGEIKFSKVQLCPQNCIQRIDENYLDKLLERYPNIEFRFHANVRIFEKHRLDVELSSVGPITKAYFKRLATLAKHINAKAYTLHSGKRVGRWCELIDKTKWLEDLMQIPVGIEGQYPLPLRPNKFWIDSWSEYSQLLESKVNYALDLSHLNIVYAQSGILERSLVADMLASEYCIEVHVSDNDGLSDKHRSLDNDTPPWWLTMLGMVNPDADIFYEGNLLHMRRQS